MVIGLVYWTWIAARDLRTGGFAARARFCDSGIRSWRPASSHAFSAHPSAAHSHNHCVGTLGVATNVMLEASLSYLGIGVQPPTPSWGGMIQQGQSYYRSAPWLVIFRAGNSDNCVCV